MAAQIPGISRVVQAGVFSRVKSLQRQTAASGGARFLAIIGDGETEETVITSARGSGLDGLDSTYTSTTGADGRHFQLAKTNLIENRTSILKNGVSLNVLEAQIDTDAFDARYDVRVDPITGRIEFQQAHLVAISGTSSTDQFYARTSTNVGTGNPVLTSASLVDESAPAETWTVRCVSVVKDGYGNSISGQATFSVSGSVSGVIKDASGNPIRWKSNGVVVSNDILSFSIVESATKFVVGDRFTITVDSGVLSKNDEVLARYIALENLNDPELFDDPNNLFAKHGDPSVSNTLSLGAQMAFDNGAPSVIALQAKPSVPRRTSAVLMAPNNPLTSAVEGSTGGVAAGDTIFPFPLGARPDADTEVHIFIMNSDGTEQQLVLSKQSFYNEDYDTTTLAYSQFVAGPFSQAYTVIETPEVEDSGQDGYVLTLSTTSIRFQSDTASFSSDRIDSGEDDTLTPKQIIILTPSNVAGTYNITQVGDGYGDSTIAYGTKSGATLTATQSFTNVHWQVIDPADTGAQLAITDDIALNNLTVGKGIRVSYIDEDDADFFDTNWAEALEMLEGVDCQLLVPLPTQTVSNIFQAARVHVEDMSSTVNKRERRLIIGALDGLVPNNLIGTEDAAVEDIGLLEGIQGDDVEEVLASNIEDLADYSVTNAYGTSFRVQYLSPDRIVRNIAGQNTLLPGYFMAAALGGFYAGLNNVAESATNKVLSGFTILRDRQYRQFVLDQLAGAGVTVVQPVAGGGRVLHSITTISSGAPEEEEPSVIDIRDQSARAMRNALSPFIGALQQSGTTFVASLTATVNATLGGLVSQGLLQSFSNVTVQRDPNEARQFNVSAVITPTLATIWIFVDLSIVL